MLNPNYFLDKTDVLARTYRMFKNIAEQIFEELYNNINSYFSKERITEIVQNAWNEFLNSSLKTKILIASAATISFTLVWYKDEIKNFIIEYIDKQPSKTNSTPPSSNHPCGEEEIILLDDDKTETPKVSSDNGIHDNDEIEESDLSSEDKSSISDNHEINGLREKYTDLENKYNDLSKENDKLKAANKELLADNLKYKNKIDSLNAKYDELEKTMDDKIKNRIDEMLKQKTKDKISLNNLTKQSIFPEKTSFANKDVTNKTQQIRIAR